MSHEPLRVAVVGAGMSGLVCARTLADHGMSATVFEKSRGVGGRMATRRTEPGLVFDHGAQYFTARDPRFQRAAAEWCQRGLAAEWEGRIRVWANGALEPCRTPTLRWVGTPGMNAVCRHLATGVAVYLRHEVVGLKASNAGWRLTDRNGQTAGQFDAVIVSAPSVQAARLLAPAVEIAERAVGVRMEPCWAAMVAFQEPLEAAFDGLFIHDSPLSWVVRNSSKPGRPARPDCWVLHASSEWSREHLEAEREEIVERLLQEFSRITGSRLPRPLGAESHRWRYASPLEPLEARCLFDASTMLGACGDWCAGPRVEGAFLSGIAVAQRVLAAVGVSPTATD